MVSMTATDSIAADSSAGANQKTDVQSYLISRYREALKSGDKSYAKSCLLSTRLFSVEDPNITNEIYLMAKADGDISEAAKCFANVFDSLFSSGESLDGLASESLAVANQMKEETRLILNELKSQYLKLRSTPTTASGLGARQAPSVGQSPLLSPRLRMSSEDRSMSRDSVLRLDKHLSSNNKSFFYQQLFDHFSQDVRKNILSHSIDSCDNPFERCRLMMLMISLFNDSVVNYGHKLLTILMDLSQTTSEKTSSNNSDKVLTAPRPVSMCQYARSMLVLDAIPLIFNLRESQNLEFNLDELFQRTVNYYSEFCLERAAEEYEFEELHEGLKKAIAARILGKDLNTATQDDTIEESINVALNFLFERFLHEFTNDAAATESLKKLRQLVAVKSGYRILSFQQMLELFSGMEMENDIPEGILFSCCKEDAASGTQATTASPPPKGRGRPKKAQPSVIVSPDDGVRRHLQSKAKEAIFIYNAVLQHLFVNCSTYLRQMRSRILMRFDNPLACQIGIELTKSSNQRSSRSKNHSVNDAASGSSPAKKIKTEPQEPKLADVKIDDMKDEMETPEESPLNLEHSKQMDREITEILTEIHRCIDFLKTSSPTFDRLFSRFLDANKSQDLIWLLKVQADCMMISGDYETAIVSLQKIMSTHQEELTVKQERDANELSTLTVSTGPLPSAKTIHLRALVQSICCHCQTLDRVATLEDISNILFKIKQSGLLTDNESYSTGNAIDEFQVMVDESIGFLFFDALSLMRYVVGVLMDILKRFVLHPNVNSDTVIGHTIVLSQVDWPRKSRIYEKCIAWICANKPKSTTPQCLSALTKFTYPDFFIYIQEACILEDFMALLNLGITLDIKSSNLTTSPGAPGTLPQQNIGASSSTRSSGSSTRSGKAITTRGVNKSFKEDLKVALTAQMWNSPALIPLNLIAEFIRTSVVPYLASTMK